MHLDGRQTAIHRLLGATRNGRQRRRPEHKSHRLCTCLGHGGRVLRPPQSRTQSDRPARRDLDRTCRCLADARGESETPTVISSIGPDKGEDRTKGRSPIMKSATNARRAATRPARITNAVGLRSRQQVVKGDRQGRFPKTSCVLRMTPRRLIAISRCYVGPCVYRHITTRRSGLRAVRLRAAELSGAQRVP